jgi:hypothetical protein
VGFCKFKGPEIDLPLTVGVTPGVSEDEADDGDVSAPEEELIELMLLTFAVPVPISFRGIDFDVPPESILATGSKELFDSVEGLESKSSLSLDSCENRGFPAFSTERSGLGESIRLGTSFLDGTALRPPPDVDREMLLSLISDWELLLELADLFPFGTSPSRNFSPGD